jgi:hypothetical protein
VESAAFDVRGTTRGAIRRHLPLLTILLVGCFAHLAIITNVTVKRTMGDEANYTLEAHRLIDSGITVLFPGQMILRHRPPFPFSFHSLFARRALIRNPAAEKWIVDRPHDSWSEDMTLFLRSVSLANLALLAGATIAIYGVCLQSGCGPLGANSAAALMIFNPRTGFYVYTLWPEILHIALFLTSVLFLLLASNRRRRSLDFGSGALIAGSGVLLAYAAMTKSVAGTFSWVMVAFAGVVTYGSARTLGRQRVATALLAAAILLVAFQGTLLPQKVANHRNHGTTALAHNLWRNIEGGIVLKKDHARQYVESSDDPEERERMARNRVIAYVLSNPIDQTIVRQWRSFLRRIRTSYVHRAFQEGRWEANRARGVLEGATTAFSWSILALGMAGLLLRGLSSPGAVLISLFTLFYAAGLLIVIPNARMYVQLVPPLIVLTALFVDWLRNPTVRPIPSPPPLEPRVVEDPP